MVERGAGSASAERRCVVLGASNVARNLSIVLATARRSAAGPVEILAAMGHGRGYGSQSSVLGWTLPPIVDCGLWSALEQRRSLPTWSIVTDIGNDLLYGAAPAQVSEWVEAALQRLATRSERLVMTSLPLCAVQTLGERRFAFFRTLFFPSARLTLDDVLRRSCELNERVVELAARYGAALVEPSAAWYSWDPVHITRWRARAAWQHIFAHLTPLDELPSVSWRMRRSAWRIAPQDWKWCGLSRHRAQPADHWRDGSSVSLY